MTDPPEVIHEAVMERWTAIVLAGQRPGENQFAASHGVAAKALIRVGGEPMLGRVVRTLLDSPSIGRIVILAQDARSLLGGDLAWLAAEPRVSTSDAGEGISASVAAIVGSDVAPWPALVTTADHPLLRPEMVEAFIAASTDTDMAFAVVDRWTVEALHPTTRRTWVKFSDGHYSGANLFALLGPGALVGVERWARIERERKRALRVIAAFGPIVLLRAITRTISLHEAVRSGGRNIGIRLKAVVLPYAEAAIDVDKPADLELARRILASREAGG